MIGVVVRACGVAAFALSFVSVSVSAAEPNYSIRITPHEGNAFIANRPRITPDGIEVLGEDGAVDPAKSLTWYDIDSARIVPPVSENGDATILVIDDDERDRVTTNFGKIKLRKGYHRFHLLYATSESATVEDRVLQLDYKGPKQTSWTELPASMLQHQPHWFWEPETRSKGYDAEGFRTPDVPAEIKGNVSIRAHSWEALGNAPRFVEDLRQTTLTHYGSINTIRPPDAKHGPSTGCVVYGAFNIPSDGEYRFRLKSDGVSCLVIGDYSPRFSQKLLTEEGDEWDVKLAYDGRLIAPLLSFDKSVLTFGPRTGGSKHDEKSIAVPVSQESLIEIRRRVDGKTVELPSEPVSQTLDVVFATGSSGAVRGVEGKAIAVREDKLVFEYEGEERTVPLDRVQGVRFAPTELTNGRPPAKPVLLAGLPGIGRVPVASFETSDQVEFTFTAIGLETQTSAANKTTFLLGPARLRGFDVYGGGSVNPLDLNPQVASTALLDLPPPLSFGTLPDGQPLTIARKKFSTGFAAGPKTTVTVQTGGAFRACKFSVGLAANGNAAVRVVSGEQVLWEKKDLTEKDGAIEVSVNVSGLDQLSFEVGFGSRFDVGDLVVFGDPQLVRGPATEPVAALEAK